MKSVWKEDKGITIELAPDGPNIDASVRDEYNLYDFARRSDGFKRFITFLLMVSARARTEALVDTLYLHDEPDISLHPSGARYLRDKLIKIAAANYVVYSTHSIFMVDRELLRRHLIVEKTSEVTEVREVDDSNITEEEVIYNAPGYSVFENLKKNNVIFEGWRDKRLCMTALKSVSPKHKALRAAFSEVGMCAMREASRTSAASLPSSSWQTATGWWSATATVQQLSIKDSTMVPALGSGTIRFCQTSA